MANTLIYLIPMGKGGDDDPIRVHLFYLAGRINSSSGKFVSLSLGVAVHNTNYFKPYIPGRTYDQKGCLPSPIENCPMYPLTIEPGQSLTKLTLCIAVEP